MREHSERSPSLSALKQPPHNNTYSTPDLVAGHNGLQSSGVSRADSVSARVRSNSAQGLESEGLNRCPRPLTLELDPPWGSKGLKTTPAFVSLGHKDGAVARDEDAKYENRATVVKRGLSCSCKTDTEPLRQNEDEAQPRKRGRFTSASGRTRLPHGGGGYDQRGHADLRLVPC